MGSRVQQIVSVSLAIAALSCSMASQAAVVAAADVVPQATFIWGTNGPDKWGQVGLSAGGTAEVTAEFPRNTGGSVRLGLVNTSDKAGVAYYPTATFGKLSDLTAASYDWLVHTTDTANQAPVLRLYLRTAEGVHTQTLVYTPDVAGVTGVPLDTWTTTNMVTGIVWQGRSAALGGIDFQVRRPFAEYQADPRFRDLIVFAVEAGAGNGSSGFVAAVDNVNVVGSLASVSANFEMVRAAPAPPPAPAVVRPVPAMSVLGLLGLSALLGGLGLFQRRRHNGRT